MSGCVRVTAVKLKESVNMLLDKVYCDIVLGWFVMEYLWLIKEMIYVCLSSY